jgi:tight adherence protein C
VVVVVSVLSATSILFALLGFSDRSLPAAVLLDRDESRLSEPVRVRSSRSLARLGRTRLARAGGHADLLVRRLQLAGDPVSMDVLRGAGLVAACAMLIPLVSVGLTAPFAILAAPLVGVGALRCPHMVVARLARRRQACLEAQVPDLVELLVAVSEAGLNPVVALRRSAEVLVDPLGAELCMVAANIDLGLPWRDALGALLERTDSPSLKRLASALTRSSRLGTSVASTLRSVAEDLRARRRTHAEELARRAPVKMLFPLVFLILPAFLLLTVGPVVLATVRSLR